MNPANANIYQSANSSTSTLRPRNTRLISYEDGELSEPLSSSGTLTPPSASKAYSFSSRFESTSTTRLDRAKSVSHRQLTNGGQVHLRATSEGRSLTPGHDLWSSWSKVSGIASSLLGSDVQSSTKGKGRAKSQTLAWMKQAHSYGVSGPAKEWGPNTETTTVSPSQNAIEERQAQVQAKKREALLLASTVENKDGAGRYKRRDSDADIHTAGRTDTEDEALVYFHKIQPNDTLAGVMIKYSCQPDAFRKVNRFWPNDNIQTRKHVFLPVEACLVRGKRVDDPRFAPDILGSGIHDLSIDTDKDYLDSASTNDKNAVKSAVFDSPNSYEQYCYTPSQTGEPDDFRHDSWVTLPSFPHPVEILRTGRRALGYFPRARRKSNSTFTDTSAVSTPKTSFDMLRHPPTHAAQTSMSLNASPVRYQKSPRQRSSSNATTTSAGGSNNNTFTSVLRGPGGVGTLRGLRTEISRPGPADDPLNKKFAQYLPDVAPPQDFPTTGFSSSRLTPRVSTDSARSRSRSNSVTSSLGEVGGTIEGWVRKFAGVSGAVAGNGGNGGSGKNRAGGVGKMGDLIELETNNIDNVNDDPDMMAYGVGVGDDDDATPTATPRIGNPGDGGEDDNEATPRLPSTSTFAEIGGRSTTRSTGSANTTATAMTGADEALLNERFPIRGRVRNAYDKKID